VNAAGRFEALGERQPWRGGGGKRRAFFENRRAGGDLRGSRCHFVNARSRSIEVDS
jgi:hypothetical protein